MQAEHFRNFWLRMRVIRESFLEEVTVELS